MGGLRIQGAGRFIAEEDIGVARKSPSDCDSLFLSAAERGDRSLATIGETDEFEQLGDSSGDLSFRGTDYLKGIGHILGGVPAGKEVEVLEDHPHSPSASDERFLGKVIDSDFVEVDFTGIRFFKKTDQAHQGGLARSAFTDDSVDQIGGNRQTDSVDRMKRAITLFQVFQSNLHIYTFHIHKTN